jgi:deoxyribonuclease-4
MTNETIKTPKFGPSGHSESYLSQYSATIDMPKWLSEQGLELFEYSFGKGVRLSEKTAKEIGSEASKYNIEISVHAPYFISFASLEQEKVDNSIGYLTASLRALRHLGGERCIFHTGSEGGKPRVEAYARAKDAFIRALDAIKQEGLDDLIVCPETMGKQAQIGTVEEVIDLCKLGDNVYPCIDFGHINALYGGILKNQDDFQAIIDKMFDGIGEEKTKNMHVHFSKIQYGPKGEIKHLTFEDQIYGPEFDAFADVIVKNNLTPHVLSESAGTQSEDALNMKQLWMSRLVK